VVVVEAQTTYARSDGGYCTEIELWERLEAGEWTPCCWDPESGEEWVETDSGELIALVPVADETPQPV
jgi:hypothetical protein